MCITTHIWRCKDDEPDRGAIVLYGKKAKFRIDKSKLSPAQKEQFSDLRAYLNDHSGIQKEVLSAQAAAEKLPLAETYWDGNWRAISSHHGTFYKRLHDFLANEIETAAIALYQAGKRHLKILDIPCGQNPLLETLLKRNHLFFMGFSHLHFVMTDRSKASIDLCQSKQGTLPPGVTGNYIVANAESFRCFNCDIIISSGGLLHTRIAKNRNQAKVQLKKYYVDLAVGGYLITSGLSPIFISANTMRKAGFEVLKGNCKNTPNNKNVYVAKKSLSGKLLRLGEEKPNYQAPLPLPRITGNLFAFYRSRRVGTLQPLVNTLARAPLLGVGGRIEPSSSSATLQPGLSTPTEAATSSGTGGHFGLLRSKL